MYLSCARFLPHARCCVVLALWTVFSAATGAACCSRSGALLMSVRPAQSSAVRGSSSAHTSVRIVKRRIVKGPHYVHAVMRFLQVPYGQMWWLFRKKPASAGGGGTSRLKWTTKSKNSEFFWHKAGQHWYILV